MFTGIIEDVGAIAEIRKLTGRWEFRIETRIDLQTVRLGDSIAVDGVCLTVVSTDGTAFCADTSLETLRVTTLKDKSPSDAVNLEQAMRPDSRLGGHIVMGHVDAVGRITAKVQAGDSIRIEIEVPEEPSRYVVKKGSVAIDGISLTVNDLSDNRFTLNLIPYSASKTTLVSKKQGDQVNVETDILGRYVENFVGKQRSGMDLDFLYKYGYIKGR
jgi:riboflavin synthase